MTHIDLINFDSEIKYDAETKEDSLERALRNVVLAYMKYWGMTSAQMKRYCNNVVDDVIDTSITQCVKVGRPIPPEWRNN